VQQELIANSCSSVGSVKGTVFLSKILQFFCSVCIALSVYRRLCLFSYCIMPIFLPFMSDAVVFGNVSGRLENHVYFSVSRVF
jgi:hypothetical protein